MPEAIVSLADGIAAAIAANTTPPRTVTRRYVPYFDAKEVENGKWFVMVAEEEPRISRHVDSPRLTIDLAYQQALPEPTDAVPDPLNDLPTMDALSNEVEVIKSLFAENGVLRRKPIADCVLQTYRRSPLYRQDFLYEMGIFFSVIRLEYFLES